ncbi:MAG: hypothetical protein J0L93_00790 [Deltaproteobacteria bacterium]|nr:hypothetical protein [Deltaproteobacteria bacterium]
MSATVQPFRMSFQMKTILGIFIAAGVLCLHLTFQENVSRAWLNVLIGSTLFLGMGLCGLFFTAIQHLTSAKWSVVLRRIFEAMSLTLPIAAILFFFVFRGMHHLYEWTHEAAVAHDLLLQWKAPFLNERAFGIRLIIYFAIWIVAALCLVLSSLKQDKTGDISITKRNFKKSALILVLFGLSVTMAGFDILMSIEPHWFSTMFGVYFFAGFFQAGLAMIMILAWILYRRGTFQGFVSIDHFHDINRFVFGFSIFWAYIAFCQFMLIWYANLPEETFFFYHRMNHGWEWVSFVLLTIRWGIPFLVLMPFAAKRNFKVTVPIAALIIFGQWLDIFWVTNPAMRLVLGVHEIAPSIQWKEIAIGLGFVSLFLFIVGFIMERIQMVPVKDPRLEASIHYYHHG